MTNPFRSALIVSLLFLGARAAEAEMRPVTIQNDGTNPIYKLYGWPTELVPRTFNLLSAPIAPGESKDIKIEDAYGSCVFVFQADFNNPRKPMRALKSQPKFIGLGFRDNVNLCGKKVPKVAFR